MAPPTPEQIAQVQSNLANLQQFNDWIHDDGQDKIANAFDLLTEPDSDPGMEVVLALFRAVVAGIGSVIGPIGTAAGNLLGSLVTDFGVHTPPNLNGTFGSYIERFNATWRALDLVLAEYRSDVVTHWDTGLTIPGTNQEITLGSLCVGNFPPETDPDFIRAGDAAGVALDRNLWLTMLKAGGYYWFRTDHLYMHGAIGNKPGWTEQMLASLKIRPEVYCPGPVWKGEWVAEFFALFSGSTALNMDCNNYIFQDMPQDPLGGAISNPNGLWTKEYIYQSNIFGQGISVA
jgi:hypothetical protein